MANHPSRVLVVYGTRPEAIKMAPVVRALEADPRFEVVVAVTAQHRSMLDQVNDLFGITPQFDFDILHHGQTLTDITVRALSQLSPLVETIKPEAVLVQGDTSTTFVGALAGFYARLPVVHLEAGLRTGVRDNPFPEEINRRLTTQLSNLHLAPTATSRANLLREGVDAADVVVTGNTVIDALQSVLAMHGRDLSEDPELRGLELQGRRVVVLTTHRRESWGGPMRCVSRAVARVAKELDDVHVVLPIHKNPVVREAVIPSLGELSNVTVLEPLSYLPFARLLSQARVVLTDSGGVQEEAPSLGVPVLVARDTTERPEAVEAGTVRLVGTDEDVVHAHLTALLTDDDLHSRMSMAVNPYGDGEAVPRVLESLAHLLRGGERPREFSPAGEHVTVGAQ